MDYVNLNVRNVTYKENASYGAEWLYFNLYQGSSLIMQDAYLSLITTGDMAYYPDLKNNTVYSIFAGPLIFSLARTGALCNVSYDPDKNCVNTLGIPGAALDVQGEKMKNIKSGTYTNVLVRNLFYKYVPAGTVEDNTGIIHLYFDLYNNGTSLARSVTVYFGEYNPNNYYDLRNITCTYSASLLAASATQGLPLTIVYDSESNMVTELLYEGIN